MAPGATARLLTHHAALDSLLVKNAKFDIHSLKWTRMHPISKHTHSVTSLGQYVRDFFGPVTRVGQGKSGSTFTLRVTPAILRIINASFCERLSHCLVHKMPKINTTILLKVVDLRKKKPLTAAIAHHKRETEAHIHLCKHPPVRIGSLGCRYVIDPGSYVPCLYAFGIDMEHGIALTCMEYVEAVPIRKVPITARLFTEVETAMIALWSCGIDHNDSHLDNILVTPDGHVRMIDFEFATRIPKSTQREFIDFLDAPGGLVSLSAASKSFFTRHANAVHFQRTNGKMAFYNPGYKALRVLWNRMSKEEQRKVTRQHEGKSLACVMSKR